MIPVEGHKHLYRDEKSGAIINTDSHGFSQYKKSKKLKLTQKEEIDSMKKDIEEIKKSLVDIHKVLSEAKGGWKTLMWAAGAGSAVTAFFIMIQQLFWGK